MGDVGWRADSGSHRRRLPHRSNTFLKMGPELCSVPVAPLSSCFAKTEKRPIPVRREDLLCQTGTVVDASLCQGQQEGAAGPRVGKGGTRGAGTEAKDNARGRLGHKMPPCLPDACSRAPATATRILAHALLVAVFAVAVDIDAHVLELAVSPPHAAARSSTCSSPR